MAADTKPPIEPKNSGDAAANMQTGSSGGSLATDIGTQDELKREIEGDTGITRVTKEDKVQPDTGTRSDHAGASGSR